MSGIVSTLSSTKGDHSAPTNATTSSRQATKAAFDHLDVNRLFKGKTAEPTTKLVAQKHGMQTLGKVLPARRAGGGSSVTGTSSTGEDTLEGGEERKGNPEPPTTFQDPNQGWMGQQSQGAHQHTQQQPPRHPIPNQIQPLLDQKWNGGRPDGNFPGSRFAQEFPSLDAAVADGGKAQSTMSSNTHRPQPKSQDNQYGPGPILRPQTEGSWTLGGSAGKRPSPPNQQLSFPPDRPMGPGPLPGQMPIGQIPPPLGAYQPTLRPNQQQPNIPYAKGSGSGFYPGGANPALRFGMPIPHDAPPPGQGGEAPPPLRRAPPPPRPGSHFTSKPIIRQEELERMDEIGTHEGDWASANDDVDYNKKINFSDEEEHNKSMPSPHPHGASQAGKRLGSERQAPRFLHREEEERGRSQQVRERERDVEDDWRQRREIDKDRDYTQRGRDDDWRSGPIRPLTEDFRNKKGPVPMVTQQRDRERDRPQDYSNTNVPPRFLRRTTQNQPQPDSGVRHRESPAKTTNGGKEPAPSYPPYKILERKRGESESSRESRDSKDKRPTNAEPSTRPVDLEVKSEFRKKDTTPPSSFSTSKGGAEPEKSEKRLTGSWAEEMDEDESLNGISEIRKSHVKEVTPALKKEERRDRIESKRIIKQTKVADMQTVAKEESPPKQNAVKKDPNATGPASSPSEPQPETVKSKAWDVEKSPPKVEEVAPKEPTPPSQPQPPPPAPQKMVVEETRPEGRKAAEEGVARKDVSMEDGEGKKEGTFIKEEAEDKKAKPPPQRKNSKESKHPVTKQEYTGDSAKDDGKKAQHPQQQAPPSQPKSQEHNVHQKEQRGSGDGRKEDKRNQPPPKHQGKGQTDGKYSASKVEEGKPKSAVVEEGRRQGSGWNDKQQRRGGGGPRQQQYKDEEEPPKDFAPKNEATRRPDGESGGGGEFRRGGGGGNKSPSGTKRNPTTHSQHGGGAGRGCGSSRLQGYGPPSDRSPFSTSTNKEPEEERKDKEKKDMNLHSTRLVIPPPTSGPVPLMALGEISPPDFPLRNRHQEYGRAPRFQRGFPPPQRDRPHKSQPNNTKPSGKGNRRDDSEQDSSSRWSKNSKPPQSEECSKNTGSGGTETEQPKDTSHQSAQTPPAAPPQAEPLAELGKVPTMVFENTKLKMSEPQQQPGKSLPPLLQSQQLLKTDERKSYSPSGIGVGSDKGQLDQGQGMDLGVQGALPFPKESSPVKLDFGTGFGEDRESKGGVLFHQQTARSYSHVHQDEFRSGRRISPLQTELPESLQGLRSLWDTPPLPPEGTQDSSPLSSFGQESESGLGYSRQGDKQDQASQYHLAQMQRNIGNMGQPQGTNGFQATQVPASVSVIAKPVSSGSPTGLNRQQHPQMKTLQQQQMSLESQPQQQQSHGPISFSPFGYGANAFGPIGGVPSPPSIYAQKSTQLYQQFNHHDNAHVLSGAGRSHSQYGNYTNMGGGAGNPYGSSLYLQPFDNFGPYATHSGPPQPPASLQLQSNNRISPGLPPTSAAGHPLPSPGMMNSTTAPPGNNAFKTVQVRNPTTHNHPSLIHQNNQQPFSQLTHHMAHPHLTPIGPQKTPYSQQQLQPQTQPQLYIPFEPSPQSMMNLGGNYGGLRTGGAPPPSGTPPMQGLSSYYTTGTGVSQGYPQQNPQGGSLPMQVPPSNPHYGIQFQPPYNNSQVQGPSPNVLGNSLTRAQHGNRK